MLIYNPHLFTTEFELLSNLARYKSDGKILVDLVDRVCHAVLVNIQNKNLNEDTQEIQDASVICSVAGGPMLKSLIDQKKLRR